MLALDLSPDIWIHILYHHLDAQDILNLLQTCRTTYVFCSSVKLWEHKLSETIKQDVMFAPSFDRQSMSLHDYKRATLAPARMEHKLEAAQTTVEWDVSSILPIAKRLLPLSMASPILMMLMIPGGRFLIAKTVQEIVVIDIESDVEPTQKMRQKNVNEDPTRVSSIFIASPTIDGSKFRVATVAKALLGTPAARISILEFNPEKRELVHLASRQVDQARSFDTNSLLTDMLAGQLFCYYSESRDDIIVWNFERDILLSWHVDPSVHGYQTFRKLVVDYVRKYLILFTNQTLLFWDINDILSFTKSSSIPDFPPKWVKPFDIYLFSNPTTTAPDIIGQSTFLCIQNGWYHVGQSFPGFDLLAYEHDYNRVYYHTYEIYYEANTGAEPFIRLAQMHYIPQFQQLQSVLVTKQSRLCMGKTVLLWDNWQLRRLFVLIRRTRVDDTELRSNDNTTLPLKHTYLSDAELVHPATNDGIKISGLVQGQVLRLDRSSASTFDPASGRFCTTANGSRGVLVTDYLGGFGIED